MKHQVFFGIAVRIIILFVIAMLTTFIPDHLHEFFGDVSCEGKTYEYWGEIKKGCHYSMIDDNYEWGVRHYWFHWMMIVLFLLSLVNLIVSTYSLVTRHYPSLK